MLSLSEEIDEAARVVIEEAHALTPVAERCAAERGWSGSRRSWRARVSRWGSHHDPHTCPAWALPILVQVTGRDPFTPILLRAGLKRMRKPARRKHGPHAHYSHGAA